MPVAQKGVATDPGLLAQLGAVSLYPCARIYWVYSVRCERAGQASDGAEQMPDGAAAKPAPPEFVAQAMTCARVTMRNSSGLAMPVKRMKSFTAVS